MFWPENETENATQYLSPIS